MALTSMPGFSSWELDATSASVSAVLPDDEVVYMEGIPEFPLPKGKCSRLLRTLYGLMQAPLAFHKLCREDYTGVGYRQLQSDECVFVRYEVDVKKGSKTAKELRTLTTLRRRTESILIAHMMLLLLSFCCCMSITQARDQTARLWCRNFTQICG
jgi:hypothetical protein